MLKTGWAHRDFTPTRKVMLQGQKHTRIADEACDPLTLTAMALDHGHPSDAVVLVSLDIAFPPEATVAAVRAKVAAACPDLPADHIVLCATHTHTSLVMQDGFYVQPEGDVMTPTECSDHLAELAAEAVIEAWTNRSEHVIGRAFGHAVVGHQRHAVYDSGEGQMYGQPARPDFSHFGGYEDHSLDMIFTWSHAGELTGVALAIPCPSQVVENLNVMSADYWHDVRLELRKRLGNQLHVLGLCAAAGDQSPHFLIYNKQEQAMRERRGLTECQEIAHRVADAVERALACTSPADAMPPTLTHEVATVTLTPRQVSQAERDWAAGSLAEWLTENDDSSWWPQRLKQVVDTGDGRFVPDPVDAEIHVIRIGDLAVATCPFELFLDYSMQIKAKTTAAQTMLVQLTGLGFYLPSKRAVAAGGYGAMPAVSAVGPEGGRELVNYAVTTINAQFSGE